MKLLARDWTLWKIHKDFPIHGKNGEQFPGTGFVSAQTSNPANNMPTGCAADQANPAQGPAGVQVVRMYLSGVGKDVVSEAKSCAGFSHK